MQAHRISAGALIEHAGRLLLVHHVRPGQYDFWVSPGGGVKEGESLEEAAAREVFEETGLRAEIGALRYIEDMANPACRTVKFWFAATVQSADIRTDHPEAQAEHITEAAWLAPAELDGRMVFPTVLGGRYATDKAAGFPEVVRLPLRQMSVW